MVNARAQSALEYILTYGWALLIIAIALVVLILLGAFSQNIGTTSTCTANSGYTCQNPELNTSGYVAITFGQAFAPLITIDNVGCSTNGTVPVQQSIAPVNLSAGTKVRLIIKCPIPAGSGVGTHLIATLWIGYTEPDPTAQFVGFATLSATATTSGSVSQTTSTSSSSTSSTSTAALGYYSCASCQNNQTGYACPSDCQYYINSTCRATLAKNSHQVYCSPTMSITTSSTTSTSTTSTSTTTASAQGYVYCAEGSGFGGGLSEYAPLYTGNPYGVGGWNSSSAMLYNHFDGECDVSSGYIYCVGGYTNDNYNESEFASYNNSGIGTWTATTDYPLSQMTGDSCNIANGYIYCVGFPYVGRNQQSEYATVSSAGIGGWNATTPFPAPYQISTDTCQINNGYIYCLTYYTNATFYAPVSGTGIGTWVETTNYPLRGNYQSCAIDNNIMYCLGDGAADNTTVFYAPVSGSGIGGWNASTPLPLTSFSNGSCDISNGIMFCFGPQNTGDVYYAPVSSTGVGGWNETTSSPQNFQYTSQCNVVGAMASRLPTKG